jgi:hypothetical protein
MRPKEELCDVGIQSEEGKLSIQTRGSMTATETLEVKLAALKNRYSFIMYRCGVLPAPVWVVIALRDVVSHLTSLLKSVIFFPDADCPREDVLGLKALGQGLRISTLSCSDAGRLPAETELLGSFLINRCKLG